jgi:hypothetical protein
MASIKELIQSIESGDSSFDEKLAAINQMEETLIAMRNNEEQAVNDNVELIVEAIKVMEKKVNDQLEIAKSIVPEKGDKGDRGLDGAPGRDGVNGRDGRDGKDGQNGQDGADGVSVTDAKIDFDGSLIITLSTGREINVGEVVASDLAEKIKVISTMSTNTAIADITGGTINNTVIGGTTPAAGTFTTLTATGQTDLGGTSSTKAVRVETQTSTGQHTLFSRFDAGNTQKITAAGTANLALQATGGGFISIRTADGSEEQARITRTASAVNYVQVTGNVTTSRPVISAQGSDGNVGLNLASKGNRSITLLTNSVTAFDVLSPTSGVNYFTANGSITGQVPSLVSSGTDTNIAALVQSKGTGAIDLAAGSSGVNISNGGTVTAITRTANGTGYTGVPSVAISAPTTAGGVQATATVRVLLNSATVANGGTGYTVGDVLTISGATGPNPNARLNVTAVSGGVVTAVTVNATAIMDTVPSNPASFTGGTGSGATFNCLYVIENSFNITNAGSGYVEQPTVTFSGGGGSGAAAYATVGSGTVVKTLGSTISFYTPAGEQARVSDSGNTTDAYVSLKGASATSGGVYITAAGAVRSMYLSSGSGASIRAYTGGEGTNEQFRIAHTASAVNYVQVTGASTTNAPVISGQGTDTDVGIAFRMKGAAGLRVQNASGLDLFRVTGNSGTVANYVRANGSLTGVAPFLSADGTDTNIDLTLTPKGTGLVRFGTYTAGAPTATGYISIKTADGTTYKVLVGT